MSSKRRQTRPWWKVLGVWLACAALTLVLLAAAGIYWLSHHSVSLDSLAPSIESALSEQLAPHSVELEGLVLGWGGRGTPVHLAARDARVLDPKGTPLVTFGQLEIDLSVASLLRGKVTAEGVVLVDMHATIIRKPDGGFDLGEPTGQATDSLSEWLESSGVQALLDKIGRVEARNAALEVDDRKLGVHWGSDQIDARLEHTARGIEGQTEASLFFGDARAGLSATSSLSSTDNGLTTRIELTDLTPAALAEIVPDLHFLKTFDQPVQGWFETRLTEELQLQDTSLGLQSDRGNLTATIALAKGAKSFSTEIKLEKVNPWMFAGTLPQLEGVQLPVDAQASLRVSDSNLDSLDFHLTSNGGSVAIDPLPKQGFQVSRIDLAGRIERGFSNIVIESAEIALTEGPKLIAKASAEHQDDRFRIQLHADLDEVLVARLDRYWPVGTAAAVERWIATHITAGSIHRLAVDLEADRLTGDAPRFDVESLAGSFVYRDLRLDLFPPQPALTQIDGKATFSTREFSFEVAGGKLAELTLGNSQVAITGLQASNPALTLDVPSLTGPASTVVQVISGEPLSLVPVDLLQGLSAQIATHLHMTIPLSGPINLTTMDLNAQSDVRDLAWTRAPLGISVQNGDLQLQLDNESLVLDGSADFNDVPAKIELREFFDDADLRRRFKAQSHLDDTGATRLGLPEQPYFSGPADLDLTVETDRSGVTRIEIDADLLASQLSIPQIGWHKPPDQAAKVSAHGTESERGWRIDNLDLEAGDLAAEGSFELAIKPFRLLEADLSRLELGVNTVHGSVSRQTDGSYLVDTEAHRIDVSPLLKLVVSKSSGEKGEDPNPSPRPTVRVLATVDELQLTPEIRFQDFVADANHDGRTWNEVDLSVGGDTQTPLTFRLDTTDDGRKLEVSSHDLGAVAKLTGTTAEIQGGKLDITATNVAPEGPWTGRLLAHDFTVVGHPWLARILKLGSFEGLLNSLNSDGLEIIRVEGEFNGTRERLQLTAGRAHGHGLGVTAEGWLDFDQDALDLSGAVLPARTIRKVLGKIPIVKEILFGPDEDRGFATRYRVSGPFEDIQIEADPVSTLTPGIAREIFKFSEKQEDAVDK